MGRGPDEASGRIGGRKLFACLELIGGPGYDCPR
jgi:hypothetical protein